MTLSLVVDAFNDVRNRKKSHKVYCLFRFIYADHAKNLKMEVSDFKTPYKPGDLARLPFEKKLELMIQAEGGFIGWGFLLVTRDGVDGPPVVDKGPFPEGYKRAGLEDLIQKRCSELSRTVRYAVDVFIDPSFLDISTVDEDPDSDCFPISRFIDHPKAYMILANGHRRIHCVTRMLSDRQNTADEVIPWLAKFYDLGET
jgi:hypothetical protein